MISRQLYHQELVALLDSPAVELCTVGQINPQLQQLLLDTTVYSYVDIKQCLEPDTSMPASSVLMMIRPDAIDTLPILLGTVCQRFPNQVLIELQHDINDKTAALEFRQVCFAMGFRLALRSASDGSEYQLYEYRLKNYKQAPDWLNSRFWAHPERYNTR
ncbi:MAG: DUF6231 family protein [Granulosicoccaceae bacterium]